METGWFVYLTVIALLSPTDNNQPKYIPGDVIKTELIASAKGNTLSEREKNCHKGGKIMADSLQDIGKGSVKVFYTCVELPAIIEELQEEAYGPNL